MIKKEKKEDERGTTCVTTASGDENRDHASKLPGLVDVNRLFARGPTNNDFS